VWQCVEDEYTPSCCEKLCNPSCLVMLDIENPACVDVLPPRRGRTEATVENGGVKFMSYFLVDEARTLQCQEQEPYQR